VEDVLHNNSRVQDVNSRVQDIAAKRLRNRLFSTWIFGAGDEIRTHDPNLGKVVLYP
jgi:hypothetical protein